MFFFGPRPSCFAGYCRPVNLPQVALDVVMRVRCSLYASARIFLFFFSLTCVHFTCAYQSRNDQAVSTSRSGGTHGWRFTTRTKVFKYESVF